MVPQHEDDSKVPSWWPGLLSAAGGYISPAEFEADYYRQLAESSTSRSNPTGQVIVVPTEHEPASTGATAIYRA